MPKILPVSKFESIFIFQGLSLAITESQKNRKINMVFQEHSFFCRSQCSFSHMLSKSFIKSKRFDFFFLNIQRSRLKSAQKLNSIEFKISFFFSNLYSSLLRFALDALQQANSIFGTWSSIIYTDSKFTPRNPWGLQYLYAITDGFS